MHFFNLTELVFALCNVGPEAQINPGDGVQALTEVEHIKGIEYPQ